MGWVLQSRRDRVVDLPECGRTARAQGSALISPLDPFPLSARLVMK